MADRTIRLGTIFTANIDDFMVKTDAMMNRMKAMNVAMTGVGKGANFSKLIPGITGIAGAAAATTQALKQQQIQLTSLAKSWGGVLSALKVLTRYGIASQIIKGVTTSFTAGKDAIIDYDQALKNLQAVTQSTDAEVEKMGAEIKRVSSDTRLNAQQVAEGMVLIGQAGFDATQSIQTIRAAADLSVGTLEDMALSTDLLTSAIFAFQTRALESTRIADIMANAINRSKLTLDKLRVAFNYVGATARDAGVSMEQAAAAMSILSNNGIRASTIGTGLRQVLARLLSPNRALREEFEELGISVEEMNPATQGFEAVMKRLAQVLSKGKDGAIDMGKAYQLFGLRGAQTASILSKSFLTGSFQTMLSKMYEVGSASKMAEKQMGGLQAKLENLAARMKLVAIAFGEAGVTDAIKVFVDVLREAAKLLAEFLSSSVGKAIVSFTMWSAAMYLAFKSLKTGITIIKTVVGLLGGMGTTITTVGGVTTVAAARLTFLGKIITGLGNVLKWVWTKFQTLWKWMTGFGTATATTSAVVRVATFSFKGLLAALGLTSPWGIAALAIMGVIVALKAYIETTDDALKKQAEVTDASKSAWETLLTYRKNLEDLAEAQSKGEDITIRHEATIKRLKEAYPELVDKLGLATTALNDNIAKVKEFEDVEFQKYIESLTKEINLYQKSIKETAAKQGYLIMIWDGLKALGQGVLDELGKVADLLGSMFRRVAQDILKLVSDTLKMFAAIHKWFGLEVPEGLKNAIDNTANAMSNLHKKAEEVGMASDEVKKKTEELTNKYVEFGRAMAQVNENMSTEDILAMVRELGATESQIKAVETAIKEMRTNVVTDLGKLVESIGKLPDAMKEFYDSLDPGDKIKFVELKGKLDKEIAEYKKKAQAIGVVEKDQQRDIATIRANGLAKFIQDTKKEEMTAKELAQEKVRIIEEYYRKEEALSKQSVERRKQIAQEQAKSFEGMGMTENAKKVLQQATDFAIAEEKRMAEVREATREASTKVLLEYERSTSKEVGKLFKEQVNEFKNSLKERANELKKLAADARKEAAKYKAAAQKDIKDLQQSQMTDEQKLADDKKQLQEKYSKITAEVTAQYYGNSSAEAKEFYDGMKERVQGHYEDIKSLAAGLAREVKDENGRIVQTQAQGTQEAIKAINTAVIAQGQDMENIAKKAEGQVAAIEKEIGDLDVKVREYTKSVDEASKKKLELDTTEAIQNMEKAYNIVSDFKKKWDEIKSKTIELNVITNSSGGGGEALPTADDGGSSGEDLVDAMGDLKKSFDDYKADSTDVLERKGGLIPYIRRKLGGAISEGWGKFRSGFKIPGFGGGDKVRALLEPGEWVIRKEAVQKYGNDLFAALNNMELPEWALAARRKIGGSIRRASGGSVTSPSMSLAAAGGGRSGEGLSIHFHPMYMSGDRAMARKFAIQIERELSELQKRKGK